MRRVHAFGDDALGDLDAVGLADAIRAGWVSRAEVVEAAIARTEAVNPALNGLAYKAFDQARATAAASLTGGFFGGVPTFIKDNIDVAGQPTMQRRRRLVTARRGRRRRVHPAVSGHRTDAAGQDPVVGIRVQRVR